MARKTTTRKKAGPRTTRSKKSRPAKTGGRKRRSAKGISRKTGARKAPVKKGPIPPRKRRDETILTKVKTVLQDTTEKLKSFLPGESTPAETSEQHSSQQDPTQ